MATKFEDVYALTRGEKIPKAIAAGVTYNEIKAAICMGKLIGMTQAKEMENHIKEKLYEALLTGKAYFKVEKSGITIQKYGVFQHEKCEVPMDLRLSQNVYVENMMFRMETVPAPRRNDSRRNDSTDTGGGDTGGDYGGGDSGGSSNNNNNNNNNNNG